MITNEIKMDGGSVLDLHSRLFRLARELRNAEFRLARELRRMEICGGFRRFAPTMRQYAEEILGLDRGKGGDLLRIGRALDELPETAAAMESGALPWTKAREIVKVATSDTESGWVRNSEDWSVRELERVVREHSKGDDAPDVDEVPPASATQVLRFELSATDADFVKRALTVLRRQAGGESGADIDQAAALVLMAEKVVASQADAGSERVAVERFQTILHTCDCCGETTRTDRADGSAAEVDEATIERAKCDSVVVDLTPGGEGRARRTVTERTRRVVLERDGYRCAVPGCDHDLWLELHHVVQKSHGGSNEPRNLVTLCSAHHGMLHEDNLAIETGKDGDFWFDWPKIWTPEPRQNRAA